MNAIQPKILLRIAYKRNRRKTEHTNQYYVLTDSIIVKKNTYTRWITTVVVVVVVVIVAIAVAVLTTVTTNKYTFSKHAHVEVVYYTHNPIVRIYIYWAALSMWEFRIKHQPLLLMLKGDHLCMYVARVRARLIFSSSIKFANDLEKSFHWIEINGDNESANVQQC